MNFLDQQFKQKIDSYFVSKELFDSYHSILEKFWKKDYDQALSLLTKEIEKLDGTEASVLYYRLWIELLAETTDRNSLSSLQNHIIKLSNLSDINKNTLRALRGIIHLELDELDMCAHLNKLCSQDLDNPYCLEFSQRYQSRFSADQKETIFLLQTQAPLVDYFHWEYLSKSLLAKTKLNLLSKSLSYITDSFTLSPLKNEFDVYRLLDCQEFSDAREIAFQLKKKYPKNQEYHFLYAYILSCKEEYKEANKTLNSLVKKYKKRDCDIFSLLGHNSYLMSYGDTNSSDWENATNYLLEAENLLNKEGLPTKEVALNLTMIDKKQEEALAIKKTERESYNYWLLNLSSNFSLSLLDSSEEENQYLFCNLGSAPRQGDLVFFINQNKTDPHAKLISLYTVLSTPTWNSHDKYQTAVKLLHSFSNTVSLPKSLSSEKSILTISPDKQTYENPKGVSLLSEKGIQSLGKLIMKEIDQTEMSEELTKEFKLKKIS